MHVPNVEIVVTLLLTMIITGELWILSGFALAVTDNFMRI
jgi:hypothetical protein